MNVARFLGAVAIVVLWSTDVPTRAQSAPASHFGRTTSASSAVPARGGRAPTADPLAPYTSRPAAAYGGTPAATPPAQPRPRLTARNYYPTARVGRYRSPAPRVGGRCTPSRGSVLGMMGISR